MAVLVTGGSGLIGTHIIKALLDRGEEIIVYDLKAPVDQERVSFIKGSVTDKEGLRSICEKYFVDRIIHLAALLQFGCERSPINAIEINVLGTLNLLEAARLAGVKRFVFASSAAVYGPVEETITEATPILPGVSLYGAAKRLCEVLGFRYHVVHGISFIALRYWGIYGPGEVSSPGIAEVIKRIENSISGESATITEVGPEDKHHFAYVKDAAGATVLATQAVLENPRVFNIAGGEDSYVSFKEFYQMIKKLCPSAGNVLFTGKGQNRGKVDISAAKKDLGYEPRYTLKMGIEEDIEYWRTRSK